MTLKLFQNESGHFGEFHQPKIILKYEKSHGKRYLKSSEDEKVNVVQLLSPKKTGWEKLLELAEEDGMPNEVLSDVRRLAKNPDLANIVTSWPEVKEQWDAFIASRLIHGEPLPEETACPGPETDQRKGLHTARVLGERQADTSQAAPKAEYPRRWEEATAVVPGLRRWVQVKREGLAEGLPLRDVLIAHLRNRETGLGHWVTSGKDFPVGSLRHFDESLRQEIGQVGQWNFPKDIRVVSGARTGRPVGSRDSKPRVPIPSEDELREARRIVRRATRARSRT